MAPANGRLSAVLGHLNSSASASSGRARLLEKNPDDIVITFAGRTALTKAKKGGLKDTNIDDLLIALLTEVRERSNLDPNLVEDVCLANVLSEAQGYMARSSVLAAGFPVTTAASVVNRFCSSGLLAVQQIANQIIAGSIDVGIAIGAESMSTNPDNGTSTPLSTKITEHPIGSQMTQPMGQTSENVAGQFSISREAQDAFAAKSYQKAEAAQKAGWFADEIIPITVQVKDPKTGKVETRVVDQDDGIRYGTTAESLGKIRAAFPQWKPSFTTGGNASQLTDGAAAILLMKRSRALELGQPIVGKFAGATVVGLEPRIMGIGPTYAIPKMLGKAGLDIKDVDVIEINEAFGSMGVYCVNKLGLDPAKVNPRGGAIAFGHPLGCTGARQVVTALSELRRRNERIAVTSMCVGLGMGMAGIFVSEH
ncbi:Thiolase [Venustampulla echinocandica]|uniref:acetyl-CoA C-acyltransferase n=1 Tax=Venustampulla echinocandica TaxID=2656787 RepID=A0A370TPH0_9HELO|nr:Thiolase [Venustampulla echinocandica]RDL37421.1 Thiolase [Venustampulla echinocandica]